MIIPKDKEEREDFYRKLVEDCFASRNDRVTNYEVLRNWYLFGTNLQNYPTDYNKLYAHIDLLSAFLFSGETTSFVVEVPNNVDKQWYNAELNKAVIMTGAVNDQWHDTNLDVTFNDALIWALVYHCTLVKLFPIGKGEFAASVVEPHAFGVLREDVTQLDKQEAFAHEYFMTESHLRRRIKALPESEQKRILDTLVFDEQDPKQSIVPRSVEKIIINSVSPDIKGNVPVSELLTYDIAPKIKEKGILAQELWVYDDDAGDYRAITLVEGQQILHDAEGNPFVPGEHPFVKICPNTQYDYFWGRSELQNLIPLQIWMNQRVAQIKLLLEKQTNPPTSGYGLTEEKMKALLTAGGTVMFGDPTGKIEQHLPPALNDVWRELQTIEQMYDEVSGIREIMKGGGESGVRAMGHADLLSRIGSSRVKKKAAVLEDAVEKCAHLILKLMKRYNKTKYQTESGLVFIAEQLTSQAMVKVDAHSSSPIFIESQIEKAKLLFEAKAIDEEDLIDAMRYQNAGLIKSKLRKRKEAQARMAELEAMQSAKQGG